MNSFIILKATKKNLTLVSNKFDRAVIDTDSLSLLVVTSDKAPLKIKKSHLCSFIHVKLYHILYH